MHTHTADILRGFSRTTEGFPLYFAERLHLLKDFVNGTFDRQRLAFTPFYVRIHTQQTPFRTTKFGRLINKYRYCKDWYRCRFRDRTTFTHTQNSFIQSTDSHIHRNEIFTQSQLHILLSFSRKAHINIRQARHQL